MAHSQDEELSKLSRKIEHLEKINKELSDYITLLKKNVEENKKKLLPLQEENAFLTRSLLEKNEKIQSQDLLISSLTKEALNKDSLIQELNEKVNKYKEIFKFVAVKTKKNTEESLKYAVPYDFPTQGKVEGKMPNLEGEENGSPPPLQRAYSSIITKYTENKPDFSRKTAKKRGSNDFERENRKLQEMQKEVEQFYSFDKKKSGIILSIFHIFLLPRKKDLRKPFSKHQEASEPPFTNPKLPSRRGLLKKVFKLTIHRRGRKPPSPFFRHAGPLCIEKSRGFQLFHTSCGDRITIERVEFNY